MCPKRRLQGCWAAGYRPGGRDLGAWRPNMGAQRRGARDSCFSDKESAPPVERLPRGGGAEASCRPSLAQKAGSCQEAVNATLKVLFLSRLETDRLRRHVPAEPQNSQPQNVEGKGAVTDPGLRHSEVMIRQSAVLAAQDWQTNCAPSPPRGGGAGRPPPAHPLPCPTIGGLTAPLLLGRLSAPLRLRGGRV